MNTRRVLFACALLPLLFSAAAAQIRHIDAATAPSFLFVDRATGRVHLLTAGLDKDFDRVFEPEAGDIAPRWLAIDPVTERVVDSLTFDRLFSSFPIRVGVDYNGRRLFASIGGRVRAYDIATMQLLRDSVAIGSYAAVSYDSLENRLILAVRPDFTSPGHTLTLDPATGDTLMVVETGANPAMTVTFRSSLTGAPEQYTLVEGAFTSPTSQVAYSTLQPDIFRAVNDSGLGGGGNQLLVRNGIAYVVMNGTHEIRMIDTRSHRELDRSPIPTGTAGFDGPRALAFQNDSVIVVGSYAGDLRRYNILTGAQIDLIAMPGKVEALAVRDSLAFAAIEFAAGTYNADSLVVAVNLNTGVPVDTIVVGRNPVAIYVDKRGDLQVVVADTTQTAQRLITIDRQTHAVKGTRMLPGVLPFPFRGAYDPAGDSLYLLMSDSLMAYPASLPAAAGRVVYTDTVKSGAFHGVTIDGDNLLVTERPKNFGAGPGYVHLIRRSDGHRLAKFRAGAFTSTAARVTGERDSAISYYTLNEGNFASPSSTITLFEYQPNIFGADTLGKGANHILGVARGGIITVNGSHTVVATDLDNWQINAIIPVGTSGFDGPRESALLNDRDLLVTTYAGDVRVLTPTSPVPVRKVDVGGRAEGIAVANGKAFVALPFTLGDIYGAETRVAVIDSGSTLSVTRDAAVASATTLDQNYPNPAAESAGIRFSIAAPARVELLLYAATGELVMPLVDEELERGTYTVDLKVGTLPSGSYIYTLRAGTVTLTRMMKVVR